MSLPPENSFPQMTPPDPRSNVSSLSERLGGPRPSTRSNPLTGECLCCGHILPFSIYNGVNDRVGICTACRDLASANRGPCSPARGCSCYPISTKESQ